MGSANYQTTRASSGAAIITAGRYFATLTKADFILLAISSLTAMLSYAIADGRSTRPGEDTIR